MDKYINRFLVWFIKTTKRNCGHCACWEQEDGQCGVFKTTLFDEKSFCTRWIKRM